jgi:hypothetical protein
LNTKLKVSVSFIVTLCYRFSENDCKEGDLTGGCQNVVFYCDVIVLITAKTVGHG